MKIFPPQTEVVLYEQGFELNDLLDRKDASKRLSELLEEVEDPVVVALDGQWGSGKSYFLQRWVGAHQLENEGRATTVYFDAFAHDYLEDPLIALTGAIGERLPKTVEKQKWKAAKTAAYRLVRPALRIGLAAATAGATEVVGPVVDAALETGAKDIEKAADQFWKREDGRREAMESFKASLKKLTAASSEGADDEKPLIVVIDELDRCRPDYALNTLEVIKHFFAVPRVHFVLGTNMEALKHIVRARYGVGIDAEDYLKRFISLSMQLPHEADRHSRKKIEIAYFEKSAAQMGIDGNLLDVTAEQIKLASQATYISLRDIERILTRLAILPRRGRFGNIMSGWQILISSMVTMQVLRPDLIADARAEMLTIEAVDAFYGFTPEKLGRNIGDPKMYDHKAYITRGLWEFAISKGTAPEQDLESFSRQLDQFGMDRGQAIIPDIYRDYFSMFDPIGE